ncbi:uncharacterized protein LOC105190915 isoform X1 [Harpegnathos saltator]|uniref:uncharacterized protein LOC105190915 isoform X1 n=1 Tax=Harpegnathos saltator TaxID=610380 RepID=UPI00058B0308|nr:uncharacterized protein LOC105190915 isoform X1 [Harpegnathos saltator]
MRSEAALYLLSLLILPLDDPSWASAEIRGCNRTVRNSVGWIRWTGRMGRCIVRIRAPLRDPQVIEVKVRRLQVGFLKEARCEGAYFQLSDGPDDPDDEAGRYCGHVTGNATRLFLRRGPDLTITLSSDEHFASTNPVIFSAQFSILPVRLALERHRGYSASSSPTCPVECTMRNEQRSCRLTSPGYPSVYPRGIRCRVALESSADRFRIGGQPEDLFDLMNYGEQESCRIENCEDSLEPKSLGQTSSAERLARARDRADARDEPAIGIGDNWPRDNNGQAAAAAGPRRGGEEASERLMRQRHYEKKAARRRGRQYRKEPPNNNKFDASVSRPRLKSGTTRKDQRKLPNRHLAGDFERLAEMAANNAMVPEERKHLEENRWSGNVTCNGDYLALLENVDGKVLEISKFCGAGRVPRVFSRGKNVILEFLARQDGTVMHDGFQVTLLEERLPEARHANCEFVYRSSGRVRESIKSPRSWYPPNTVCTYRFLGRIMERVSIHIKILRNEFAPEKPAETRRDFSLNYCPGNEIAVYNGAQVNGSFLMWSYCDASHWDINNIQVPLTSSGNELLIQYYSAKGSYDGQGFTYAISYRFVRKEQNITARRGRGKYKSISLRPVNLSVLNLNDTDNCNCNFDNRMGTFKNWFVVLVILGIVSFLGAIVTIVALIAKFLKIRSSEKKLLQNAKQ